MTAGIYRGPLTDALLLALADVGKPIGDGYRPAGSGWQGQPNAPGSEFVPYLVLTASTSTRSSGSIGASQSEWQMNYLVSSYGVTRPQCEWMADHARDLLGALARTDVVLGPHTYRYQQVWTQTIGGVSPSSTNDPPIWSQQDQIVIWLSKGTT